VLPPALTAAYEVLWIKSRNGQLCTGTCLSW